MPRNSVNVVAVLVKEVGRKLDLVVYFCEACKHRPVKVFHPDSWKEVNLSTVVAKTITCAHCSKPLAS